MVLFVVRVDWPAACGRSLLYALVLDQLEPSCARLAGLALVRTCAVGALGVCTLDAGALGASSGVASAAGRQGMRGNIELESAGTKQAALWSSGFGGSSSSWRRRQRQWQQQTVCGCASRQSCRRAGRQAQGAWQRPHLQTSQIWPHLVQPGPKFLVHDWQSNTVVVKPGMVTYLVPNPALPAGTQRQQAGRGIRWPQRLLAYGPGAACSLLQLPNSPPPPHT